MLRSAASKSNREFRLKLSLTQNVSILGWPSHRKSKRTNRSRDDANLVHFFSLPNRKRHSRMSHLMVRDSLFFRWAQDSISSLKARDNSLDSFVKIAHFHARSTTPSGD